MHAAWSRSTLAKLMRFKLADPCISARLLQVAQCVRSVWFSSRRRASSAAVSADIDDPADDSDDVASFPSLSWVEGALSSSAVCAFKYNLRMLGVTNGRRFAGITLTLIGAAAVSCQKTRIQIHSIEEYTPTLYMERQMGHGRR